MSRRPARRSAVAADSDTTLPAAEPADVAAGSAAAEPAEPEATKGRPGAGQAVYFFGVSRVRGWRPPAFGRSDDHDVQRIRYRDLEALVRLVHYEMPMLDETRVLEHQRVIERVMRRMTVLPAPYGIVFRGRRQLIRVLEDQYLVLDEGLAFLEGHWEMRVHVRASDPTLEPELGDAALQLYAELRRITRAAVPFPRESGRVLGAAFLVERTAWLEFMERAEQLAAAYAGLSLDVTGPWPPYDFVRVTR